MTVLAVDINLPTLAQHFFQGRGARQNIMHARRLMVGRRQPQEAIDAIGLVYRFAFKRDIASNAVIEKSPLEMMRTARIGSNIYLRLNLRGFHRFVRQKVEVHTPHRTTTCQDFASLLFP